MNIAIEVDTTLNSAYIQLSDKPVARTVEHSEEILVDLDEHGVAVGIEVMNEGTPLPFQDLISKFHVHSDVVDLLRLIRPDVSAFLRFSQASEGSAVHQQAAEFQNA